MLLHGDDDLQGDKFPALPADLGPEPVLSLAQFLNVGRLNECRRYKGRRPLLSYFVFVVIKLSPAKIVFILAYRDFSLNSVKQATPPMKTCAFPLTNSSEN
jgi:hypothetical protein